MSIMPMYKKCPNCKQEFSYNPSTGNFGLVCPHCRKPIALSAAGEVKDTINKIKDLFDRKK